MYFSDYITKLRVQSAIGLLEHSDQNLAQIAMSCGFSNSSAFNRSFKKQTGMNPSEYRESRKEEAKRLLEEKEKEEETIREKLTEKGYQNGRRENEQHMLIDFDDRNKSSYTKVWQKIINFGDLYLLTHANIQQHALYLREQLHFEYIRVWNLTYEDERPLNLHVTLEHLKRTDNFYVKRRTLNRDNGSVLDEWGRFQYSFNLTRQDIQYLRAICTPRIIFPFSTTFFVVFSQ